MIPSTQSSDTQHFSPCLRGRIIAQNGAFSLDFFTVSVIENMMWKLGSLPKGLSVCTAWLRGNVTCLHASWWKKKNITYGSVRVLCPGETWIKEISSVFLEMLLWKPIFEVQVRIHFSQWNETEIKFFSAFKGFMRKGKGFCVECWVCSAFSLKCDNPPPSPLTLQGEK